MKRRLAAAICRAASRLLPDRRQGWADAMLAELAHADDDRDALVFAAGCLFAAMHERVHDIDSRYVAGLWSLAIATALFAVLQLECAARGIATLFGARDGMHDALIQHGASAALLENYTAARPVVIAGFVALGCLQLAGAWFLSRGQLHRFLAASGTALVIATTVVAIQLSIVWTLNGVPSEFHALLMQAVALPALLAWFHRRQNRLEET